MYLLFFVRLVQAHAVVLPPRGVVPRPSDPQDQQGGVPAEERRQLQGGQDKTRQAKGEHQHSHTVSKSGSAASFR